MRSFVQLTVALLLFSVVVLAVYAVVFAVMVWAALSLVRIGVMVHQNRTRRQLGLPPVPMPRLTGTDAEWMQRMRDVLV